MNLYKVVESKQDRLRKKGERVLIYFKLDRGEHMNISVGKPRAMRT